MKYLAVKDYALHQHYRNRNPVWIKLYNAVMDDEAFLSLPDAARGQLMLIWLLASRRQNKIPNDAKLIGRAIQASGKVYLQEMIDAGFLVEWDASKALAQSAKSASKALAVSPEHASPEGEREEEGEKNSLGPSADAPGYPPDFEAVWAVYPKRTGGNSKKEALAAWRARIRAGVTADILAAGVQRYATFCEVEGKTGSPFVMQARTFFGPGDRYLEVWEPSGSPVRLDNGWFAAS